MFSTLIGKKKVREAGIAKALVSGTVQTVERVFPEFKAYLEECPYFLCAPEIQEGHEGRLLLAILTCNLIRIPQFLPAGQDKRIAQEVLHEAATTLDMDMRELGMAVRACKSSMKRLNQPSKDIVKGVAHFIGEDFKLIGFQESYFKDMGNLNPIVHKELTQMIRPLVWDWEMIEQNFKLTT